MKIVAGTVGLVAIVSGVIFVQQQTEVIQKKKEEFKGVTVTVEPEKQPPAAGTCHAPTRAEGTESADAEIDGNGFQNEIKIGQGANAQKIPIASNTTEIQKMLNGIKASKSVKYSVTTKAGGIIGFAGVKSQVGAAIENNVDKSNASAVGFKLVGPADKCCHVAEYVNKIGIIADLMIEKKNVGLAGDSTVEIEVTVNTKASGFDCNGNPFSQDKGTTIMTLQSSRGKNPDTGKYKLERDGAIIAQLNFGYTLTGEPNTDIFRGFHDPAFTPNEFQRIANMEYNGTLKIKVSGRKTGSNNQEKVTGRAIIVLPGKIQGSGGATDSTYGIIDTDEALKNVW